MSIRLKMILLALVITTCVSAIAVTATVCVWNLSADFAFLRTHEMTAQLSVLKLSRDMNYLSRLSRDIMLGGDYDRDMRSAAEITDRVTEHFEALAKSAHNNEIKGLVANAHRDVNRWLDVTVEMMTALGKVPAGERHLAYPEYEKVVTPVAMQSRTSFAKILKHSENHFRWGVETFETTIVTSATTFMAISVTAVLVVMVTFFLILRTILREIENRHRAEEALSASEKTARALLDGIDNCAYLIDPAGTILAVNAKATKRSGKESASLVGGSLWDSYGPSPLGRVRRQRAAQVLAEKRAVKFEDETGGTVFDHTYYPIFDGAGGVAKIALFSMDVTEQKRALQALQESEKRFRTLIEEAPVGISMVRDLSYTYVNRAHALMYGFSDPEELVGTHICELIAQRHRAEICVLTQQCAKGEKVPAEYETVGVRKDGSQFPAYSFMTQLVFDDGPVLVSFSRDLTERKQARDLMVQNEKMLMIGGLAAGMAHEINNPVGIIVQNLQNIERRLSPELGANHEAAEAAGITMAQLGRYLEERSILRLMEKMHNAGERTSRIICNMLQFSRKSESERKSAHLPDILQRAVELAGSDYDLKKKYDFGRIRISTAYDEALPAVRVVATEIEQVMINLLKNAAQAMAEAQTPEPRIVLGTALEGSMAVVTVADNGPGMDEDTRKRVFEPFFTTKEVGGGTGLGLSVSYMLITQNHRGIFTVDSTPGSGTSFTIKLPLQ